MFSRGKVYPAAENMGTVLALDNTHTVLLLVAKIDFSTAMWETVMMPKSSKIDLSVLKENVGDQNAEQTTGQTAKSDLPKLLDEPDWQILRKAAPLNKLLGPTLQWAKDLPPDVIPVALMARYPRVANMVAARSKEGSGFHDYLVDLLVGRRGGRKGFSSDIVDEIEHLRAHYLHLSRLSGGRLPATRVTGIGRGERPQGVDSATSIP